MEAQKSLFVPDILDKRARFAPDKIALHCTITGRDITFRQWNAAASRTAHFLHALGVGKGDRVAVYAVNSVEYLDVWMACSKLGAIMQNLNWRLTVTELTALVQDAEPKVLFYSGGFGAQVDAMRGSIPSVRHFVAFDAQAHDGDLYFNARDQYPDVYTARPDLHPDDPWVICYTGGTTGLPKGAIMSHGNMIWNAINTVSSWGLDQNDVAILNSPLFHAGGLAVFTLPLLHAGGKSIVCKAFDVEQVFELVANAGVTIFFGVPTMFSMMQQHPLWEQADFSQLKIVISGGAPCPMPIFERFWAKGVDFKTGYGLTEAGPNTFVLPPEDVRRKPGAVGFPLMHIDVRAVDAEGHECPPGVAGELLIRGPHVTPGYWNNPEATRKTIVDGWLHTGDLAIRDEEGYYTIVGRLKDMIISGGENIYPAEVESVMHAHPAVSEAALIGVPDEKWGEVGLACVVVRAAQAFDSEEFLAFLRERLARYKVPKAVVTLPELPKTGPGKIDKKLLVEQFANVH